MSIDSFDFDWYKKHRTLTPAAAKSTLELTAHHFFYYHARVIFKNITTFFNL